jgi:predicted MFS family arabinose efflux permease
MVFNCIWYGLLWATLAPYIKRIVPAEGNAFAQGLWAVVAHGAGAFFGSYMSGVYAEAFGQRNLFLAIAVMMGVLALLTPVLVDDK